ncbi:MAG: hypothetical protein ACQERL_00435 [Bacillota bacterium]
MKNKKTNESLNAEMEMIRDLRKRIYGNDQARSNYSSADHQCVFCGAESNLNTYKNNYICQECLSDLRDDN